MRRSGELILACVASSAATCLILGVVNSVFEVPIGSPIAMISIPSLKRAHQGEGWQSLTLVRPPNGTHAGWNSRPYEDEEKANHIRYGCASLDRSVAITIDDGPNPEHTPLVLDKLKENGVPATFFLVVQNAINHPDIVKRMVAEGHTVGLHTMTHKNLTEVWDAGEWDVLKAEVDDAAEKLEEITGQPLKYFRAPFGAINEGLKEYLGERGLTIVMWGTGCADWHYKDAELELASIMHSMPDAGSIVCMHDTQPSAEAEIELLVHTLQGLVEGSHPAATHPISTLDHCIWGEAAPVANTTETNTTEASQPVQ